MRSIAIVLVFAAALAACTQHDANSTGTDAVPAAPASSVATQAPARSPVPAFHGAGAGWRIDLQADRGMRHTARLFRAGKATNATLALTAATPAADPSVFVFEGSLFAPQGDTPLRVEIMRADCKAEDGTVRMQTVVVTVQGAAPLRGCGEITPY